jgi:enamine deaminase RidA (YjgF/YER057c/UK114 family)
MQVRTSINTHTTWEELAGYARAVRVGQQIWVSGTTATDADGRCVGAGDAAAQMRFALQKIERTIVELGGELRGVVRTRIYVRHMADWEAVARVHGEVFAAIRPANTLVQAALVGDEYLVEVEADAVVN